MKNKKIFAALAVLITAATAFFLSNKYMIVAHADYRFSDFEGHPPIHILGTTKSKPSGITPSEIKKVYGLPSSGGTGTIAIIDAYDDPNIESDLAVFDKAFGLPSCTTKNKCFLKHKMASSTANNSGWALETSLDVEWAHAIAPSATILLVEAKTPSGANLLNAIDYAVSTKDVVAVSMSWGGVEFSDEASLDTHFSDTSNSIQFFASSGDNGSGASWPAASPYVIGVGGTSLELTTTTGKFISEKAWSGSGGGVSVYEKEPSYQLAYNIPKAGGMRAIPDVAYNADPQSGYPVYRTTGKAATSTKSAWYVVGGTSAGAPQWAAIHALGLSVTLDNLYRDKASSGTLKYFRDITSGKNGTCTYYCDARKRYDYVTGLGVPQTVKF
jgi:subtilase family serine protease